METAAVRDAACAGSVVAAAANANDNLSGAHCIVPDSEVDNDEAIAAVR